MTLRLAELFAGIGAQRMALTLAGIPHEVVAVAEINRHSLASYEAIWGDCPNLGDIREVERLPPCDLVTYSFPCQDLSLAGKRAGMGEGTRSGLVWEVMRLLEASRERERPEWLLMENVTQVLTAPEWPALVGRLEAMGYRNKWAKLDSSRFGSAQKRVRAFMVSRLGRDPPDLPASAPNAPALCLRDIMEPERPERFVRRIPLDRIRFRGEAPEAGKSTPSASIDGETFYSKAMLYSSSSSSPTVRTEHGKNSQIKVVADWDRPERLESTNRIYAPSSSSPALNTRAGNRDEVKVAGPEGRGDLAVDTLMPRECWRLMGFPEWAFLRASRVSSETQLYNQAGNSIVVEVLIAVFNAMFRPEKTVQVPRLEAFACRRSRSSARSAPAGRPWTGPASDWASRSPTRSTRTSNNA